MNRPGTGSPVAPDLNAAKSSHQKRPRARPLRPFRFAGAGVFLFLTAWLSKGNTAHAEVGYLPE